MNWINIEQQASNAMQQLKQIIDKVKEYDQMISKHYIRTPRITAMMQYSDENWFYNRKETMNNK